MKTFYLNLTTFVLSCVLAGCQPGEPVLTPEPEPPLPAQGTPTETGKPVGEPIRKTIGPAGGTISTPNNVLTVIIPAGALKKDEEISVQPVENKAWGGTGLGYELTPKNIELAKPAEVIWKYTDADVAASDPEALGIAFQQPDQSWHGTKSITVDKPQKKATAKTKTLLTVAFFQQYYLSPASRVMVPSEQADFTAYYQPGATDAVAGTPIFEPRKLKDAEVKNWRINGQEPKGDIDPQLGSVTLNGAKAQYKAPAIVPKANKLALSVEIVLPTKGKLILVANVTIEAQNAFAFAGAKVDSAYVATMAAEEPIFQITLSEHHLSKPGAQASFAIGMSNFNGVGVYKVKANSDIYVGATDRNGKDWSHSYFPRKGNKSIVGPLTITILEYDKVKKRVKGTVNGTMHIYDYNTDHHESTSIMARFNAANPN